MAKPTIAELHQRLTRLEEEMTALSSDMEILNKFMVGYMAVEADRKMRANGQGINKDLINLVLKFLAVLTAALGIIAVLIKEAS